MEDKIFTPDDSISSQLDIISTDGRIIESMTTNFARILIERPLNYVDFHSSEFDLN